VVLSGCQVRRIGGLRFVASARAATICRRSTVSVSVIGVGGKYRFPAILYAFQSGPMTAVNLAITGVR